MSKILGRGPKTSVAFLITMLCSVSCCSSSSEDDDLDDLSGLPVDANHQAAASEFSGGNLGGDVARFKDTDSLSRQSGKVIEGGPPARELENSALSSQSVLEHNAKPDLPIDQSTNVSLPSSSGYGSGSQVLFINAAMLNVREKPDRRSKIVGALKGGDMVKVEIEGGWARLDEGRWIRTRWLVRQKPK